MKNKILKEKLERFEEIQKQLQKSATPELQKKEKMMQIEIASFCLENNLINPLEAEKKSKDDMIKEVQKLNKILIRQNDADLLEHRDMLIYKISKMGPIETEEGKLYFKLNPKAEGLKHYEALRILFSGEPIIEEETLFERVKNYFNIDLETAIDKVYNHGENGLIYVNGSQAPEIPLTFENSPIANIMSHESYERQMRNAEIYWRVA